MEVFLQTIVAGILIGGIYSLIGIGMTLIMGVMGIINLAHGQLMMLAMYLTFVLSEAFRIDPYVSLFVTMPALFLVGVFLQKFFLNPLMKIESILPENQVLMTVGIGMVLTELARFAFSSDYKTVETPYSSAAFFLGGISFNVPMCIAFAIAVAFTAALFWFLLKTDVGRSIRATAQDKDAATLMGVNSGRITIITFGLGPPSWQRREPCSCPSSTSFPTSADRSPSRPSSSRSSAAWGARWGRLWAASSWASPNPSEQRTSAWDTRRWSVSSSSSSSWCSCPKD